MGGVSCTSWVAVEVAAADAIVDMVMRSDAREGREPLAPHQSDEPSTVHKCPFLSIPPPSVLSSHGTSR